MSNKAIEIDGSFGEGGGQILRTSLALSLITGKPFHLRNIRAGRANPGLHAQHLMSVQAAAQIGHARLRGASLRSSSLTFEPGRVESGDYQFAIGTAGAASLVLHTVYLPLALASGISHVTITGGTHVKSSPCGHFLQYTWMPYLQALEIPVTVTLERLGFYPRGGGSIQATIAPTSQVRSFQGISTERIETADVICLNAGLPAHVSERLTRQAVTRLTHLGLRVQVRQETGAGGPGCMLGIALPTAPATTFFFALGEKGKSAERVANEAVDQVETYLQSMPPGVDEHSADQLILPLALAPEPSQFRVAAVSSHLLTNMAVVAYFLDRSMRCDQTDGHAGIVTIT